MPASWPVGVPYALTVDSHAESFPDGRLRSQTDIGPGKTRRRSTASVSILTGTLIMSYSQWDTLSYFIKQTLAGGSLPFLFPSQIGKGTLLVRFGDDLPTMTRAGAARARITMQLEILP